MGTEYDNLRVSRSDGVTTVTIDSTTPHNSLNQQLARELVDVAVHVVDDDSRCLVLTGTDGVFSSGGALTEFSGDADDAELMRMAAATFHDAIVHLHQAEKPILVGINGPAAGAGFSLALTGDIVLVSDEATLRFAYSRIGLTGDGGVTYYLPRLVGLRKAKEIVVRDEPIGPERAVELGLATEVVPADQFDARLSTTAEQLAERPTAAVGATRRLLTESFDRSLAGQLAAETEAIAAATRTTDYRRGHAAFFDPDDSPEFTGE